MRLGSAQPSNCPVSTTTSQTHPNLTPEAPGPSSSSISSIIQNLHVPLDPPSASGSLLSPGCPPPHRPPLLYTIAPQSPSPRLIAVHDADLKSIIVKPSEMCTMTTFKLLFKNFQKDMAVFEAVPRALHHAEPITDCGVEALNLPAALVTLLQFIGLPGADAAITIEAECILQMTTSLV